MKLEFACTWVSTYTSHSNPTNSHAYTRTQRPSHRVTRQRANKRKLYESGYFEKLRDSRYERNDSICERRSLSLSLFLVSSFRKIKRLEVHRHIWNCVEDRNMGLNMEIGETIPVLCLLRAAVGRGAYKRLTWEVIAHSSSLTLLSHTRNDYLYGH